MIDDSGYRPNVGIIICNTGGHVLWGRRCGHDGWQFPQGGIRHDETPEQALFRELHEEVGLTAAHVDVLGRTQDWLRYEIPSELRRRPVASHGGGARSGKSFRGQKQMWFLLRLTGCDNDIKLDACHRPEFDAWRWISYWDTLGEIVAFKREVYRSALAELEPLLPTTT